MNRRERRKADRECRRLGHLPQRLSSTGAVPYYPGVPDGHCARCLLPVEADKGSSDALRSVTE